MRSANTLLGLSALWIGSSLALHATPIAVATRAGLGANDSVHWEKLGSSPVGSPFSTTSQLGLGLTGSGSVSPDGFEVAEQGVSWAGNFSPGDAILWPGLDGTGVITITFDSPVFGAGAQIQPDFYGAFTAFLSAYDASNTLLDTFQFFGNSTDLGDGNALFIGVLNDVENIAKIELGVETASYVGINRLDLQRTFVPDAGGLAGVFALTVGAMFASYRKQRGA